MPKMIVGFVKFRSKSIKAKDEMSDVKALIASVSDEDGDAVITDHESVEEGAEVVFA